MIAKALAYTESLRDLEITFLVFETMFAMFRIIYSPPFTLMYALTIIQPILLYTIIHRRHNSTYAHAYILIAVILIYLAIHTEITYFFQFQPSFHKFMKRGYWLEVVFRRISIHVQWRRISIYKIMRDINLLENPDLEDQMQDVPFAFI